MGANVSAAKITSHQRTNHKVRGASGHETSSCFLLLSVPETPWILCCGCSLFFLFLWRIEAGWHGSIYTQIASRRPIRYLSHTPPKNPEKVERKRQKRPKMENVRSCPPTNLSGAIRFKLGFEAAPVGSGDCLAGASGHPYRGIKDNRLPSYFRGPTEHSRHQRQA
jgi:hypothetical protein